MSLSQKRFEIPDYGIVSGDNAIFTFLRDLCRRNGETINLDDLPVGHTAHATFETEAGTTCLSIWRYPTRFDVFP